MFLKGMKYEKTTERIETESYKSMGHLSMK